MKRELAQKLLSATLDWDATEVEEYRELLFDFSEWKFDMYQQYRPGSRFIENLSIWLNQFDSIAEKNLAMHFLLDNLVFISPDTMQHLISMIFPDIISPILKKDVRNILKHEDREGDSQFAHLIYELLRRQSLFFGLSDGARVDMFRRTVPSLSNEQVCIHYEVSKDKIEEILKELHKDTDGISKNVKLKCYNKHEIKKIFLLDDFSGSGISYLRFEQGKWKGKIFKALEMLDTNSIDYSNIPIYIILYLATEEAIRNIKNNIEKFCANQKLSLTFIPVQIIHPTRVSEAERNLLAKYYSNEIEDSHYLKGKHDFPYLGFNEGSLQLVIYHNTPNNSFPILWSGKKALFPRVTRHKDVN